MKKLILLSSLLFFALSLWGCDDNTITDVRDGKVYKTVKIGSQWWMAENLNYETENSYCYDDDPANCEIYGRLYGYEVALEACPARWRLATDEDWSTLIRHIDPNSNPSEMMESATAGYEMKNQTGWEFDGNGSNSSGFSALPGGNRSPEGSYHSIGISAYIWSSTPYDDNDIWRRVLQSVSDGIFRVKHGEGGSRYRYFAVRCVKD